jgi:polyisoprenoid-binding protein YceI
MITRYRFDPGRSRFTVQAFATGLLSFLGHSPAFAVRDWTGTARFDGGMVQKLRLEITVRAESLQLMDQVRPADRQEIERAMRGEVLEIVTYPEIRFETAEVASQTIGPGRSRLRLYGRLALHGVTQPHPVEADLVVYDDGIRLSGESALRLSDYAIRPVTAAGGMIKLKDEVRLSFDLTGLPEGP